MQNDSLICHSQSEGIFQRGVNGLDMRLGITDTVQCVCGGGT